MGLYFMDRKDLKLPFSTLMQDEGIDFLKKGAEPNKEGVDAI